MTREETTERLADARRRLAELDAGQPFAEPLRRLWRRRVAELEDLRRALGRGRDDRDLAQDACQPGATALLSFSQK